MTMKDKKPLLKFLLLLAVLGAYAGYLGWKYDLATGGLVAALTWSFFVLCTPVADGGFLLDFPLRLLFGVRMVRSEMFVWAIALTLNLYAINYAHDAYGLTFLTSMFELILTTPWPNWSIIGLSAVGTFLSVHFGDAVMDAIRKKGSVDKRRLTHALAAYAALFVLIFFAYHHVLGQLGMDKVLK